MIHNKFARVYYRNARSLLPDTGKSKKFILSQLESELNAFVQEYPNAGYSDFITRFGTPEDMATTAVTNMDTMVLLKALRVRQKIWNAVIATVLVILISWGCVVTISLVDYHSDVTGTYYESTAHNEIDDYSWGGNP